EYFIIVINLIEKIPSTFWGVVVGALLSLGGIIITNRANDKRLHKQFLHERELKNRDRELSLKQDVYLKASDGISASLIALANIINTDLSDQIVGEMFSGQSHVVEKVYVLADMKTIKSLSSFTSELQSSFLKLSAQRIPVMLMKKEISDLQSIMDICIEERGRIMKLMEQYNLDGLMNELRWDSLNRLFIQEGQRFDQTLENHKRLLHECGKKLIELMQNCLSEMRRLGNFLIPVLADVRSELNMEFCMEDYMKIVKVSRLKIDNELQVYIKNLQDTMNVQES
ncbi:MAG: hypothetical protein LLF94_03855, partial [Chlamydiales bacterium]|nr:hypothetical protein [Chlamydiales bacterium]